MADTIVKVYLDGSGDFTDLADAVASQITDRVALTSSVVFELKGHVVHSSTTMISFNGWTTSEDYKIIIKSADGEVTDGIEANSTTSYSAPNTYLMDCRDAIVEFRDLHIKDCKYAFFISSNTSIYSCFIKDVHATLYDIKLLDNCIVVNCGKYDDSGSDGFLINRSSMHQCTIIADTHHGAYNGEAIIKFEGSEITPVTQTLVINETIGGNNNWFSSSTGLDWNADSESGASGTNPQFCTSSDCVDYTSGNYSTSVDSPLYTIANGERIGAFLSGLSTTVRTLSIVTNVTGADFVFLEAGTSNVLGSVDQEVTTTYNFEYTQPVPVDIGIIKQGYEVMYFYGYTLEAKDNTLYLNLRYDRNYAV